MKRLLVFQSDFGLVDGAVAINQGNFVKAYNIGTGRHWEIEFRRVVTGNVS